MRTLLIHLYPASWRGRYGEEFGALLDAMPMTPLAFADVAFAAVGARVAAVQRHLKLARGGGSDARRSNMALAALLMLVPSVAALGAIALKFKVGAGEPFDALWFGTPVLTRYIVLMLPALSLATATLPLFSVSARIEAGQGVAALGVRLDRRSMAVGLLSAGVLAALVRYFLVRHLLTMPF